MDGKASEHRRVAVVAAAIDLLVTACPRHLKYAIEGIVEDAVAWVSFNVSVAAALRAAINGRERDAGERLAAPAAMPGQLVAAE